MVALALAVQEGIHQYLQGLMTKKYGILFMAWMNLPLHILVGSIQSNFRLKNFKNILNGNFILYLFSTPL